MPVRQRAPIAAPGQKNVQIMDGNGDLAKLSGLVAGYEKYVKAFTQYPIPSEQNFRFGILPERNCHARARNPDSTSRIRSGLALPYTPRNQASRNPIWLQLIQVAALGSAKMSVNGELNGNKPDSPCQPAYAPFGWLPRQGNGDAQPARLPV